MKKELNNELEPMDILVPDFWYKAHLRLLENPGKVLPVYSKDTEVNPPVQDFFLSLVKDEGKIFMQAEGFSTNILEIAFLINVSDRWQVFQPGIYRLDVTKYLKGVV